MLQTFNVNIFGQPTHQLAEFMSANKEMGKKWLKLIKDLTKGFDWRFKRFFCFREYVRYCKEPN